MPHGLPLNQTLVLNPNTSDIFSSPNRGDVFGKKKNQSSHLPRLHKSFGYFAVAATVAGRDEVRHAAALQEGCRGYRSGGAENTGEGNHLHQAQPDHCCLCVVPEAQTVTETRPDRNNVLKDRRGGNCQ